MKKIFILLAAALCVMCSTAAHSAVIYVTTNGSDTNSGASWELAKRTVPAAVSAAVNGDEIWVAKGTYSEKMTLHSSISLYGGFAGNETELSQRNWKANPTIMSFGNTNNSIGIWVYNRVNCKIDGFTFQNGYWNVYGADYSSVIFTNNIVKNSSDGIITSGNAVVSDCVFSGNDWAVDLYGPNATVKNNIITDNNYGIYFNCDTGVISNNYVARNTVDSVHLMGSTATVANNVIVGNFSPSGGIGCTNSSTANIVNNTIVGNVSTYGGGIYCDGSSFATITNNIVAFNSSGIYAPGTNKPLLLNNCFYNPDGTNYVRTTKGATDINVDPKLVSAEYGEVHLQADSPCIDKGDDTAVVPDTTDIDGQIRISNHVDMGADESYGEPRSFAPTIVRVSPSGNNANDGSSWQKTKKTIQAGIDTAALYGGEVWVAAGTYAENIKARSYTYLYGGFAGTETSREQRNWSKNKSIIGTATPTLSTLLGVGIRAGHMATCIDGFTLLNCRSNTGNPTDNDSSIFCESSAAISNNTIIRTQFNSSFNGIYSIASVNKISGNVITGTNYGIRYLSANSTITNNTLAYNLTSIYSRGNSDISNNIIAFNSTIGVQNESGMCNLRNNCMYGNPSNYWNVSTLQGNVLLNPQFVNSAARDLHLLPTSPCINAGLNTALGIPAFDMDYENRICWGVVDIGADEFAQPAPNIAFAKQSIDRTGVSGYGAIVSAVFDNCFYIISDDRSAGIRVVKPGNSIKAGTRIDYAGAVKTTADGERYIEASSLTERGTGSVEPVAMTNKSLGGADYSFNPLTGAGQRGVEDGIGPNNIGLLIKSTGRVSVASDGYFYVDDGTHAQDGSIFSGVRVKWNGAKPLSGEIVAATGISGIMNISGKYYRCIRAMSIQSLN